VLISVITCAGFWHVCQTGIVLQVNANPVINVVLQVDQLSEQVEVQANAAMVETRRVGVGQVIENERILELPLNGRNAADLIVGPDGHCRPADDAGKREDFSRSGFPAGPTVRPHFWASSN
jgi:hypothetical protein